MLFLSWNERSSLILENCTLSVALKLWFDLSPVSHQQGTSHQQQYKPIQSIIKYADMVVYTYLYLVEVED